MNQDARTQVTSRLLRVLAEIEGQENVASSYTPNALPFVEEMKQIREYIEVAGEYGLAFEILVATCEVHPFVLSGKSAIALLELGLLFGYKTDREEDRMFDRRNGLKK